MVQAASEDSALGAGKSELPLPSAGDEGLQSILRKTPFLLSRCSADLRYLLVSPAYACMVGRSPVEIAGKPIVEIMGEQGLETILPYIERVLKGEVVEYEREVHFKDVGTRRLHVHYAPEFDSAGNIQGWIASILDITNQRKAEERVAGDLAAMTLLREVGSRCVRSGADLNECLEAILDAAIGLVSANKGNIQLFDGDTNSLKIAVKRGFDESFLKYFEQVDCEAACGAAMQSRQQVMVADVLTSEIFVGQPAQRVLLDAGVRAVVSTPVVSSKGNVLGMLSVHFSEPTHPGDRELYLIELIARLAGDYLERKNYERTERTLIQELTHRNHNLLAVIQAIANQTLSSALSLDEANIAFRGRLQALAQANRILVERNWSGAELGDIIRLELEAFGSRATTAGIEVMLDASDAQSIALVVHELATNAAKYGALSNETGMVSTSWSLMRNDGSRTLRFRWHEAGGPPATGPRKQGFGSWLLRSLCSAAKMDFAKEGLTCTIDFTLRNCADVAAAKAFYRALNS